MKGRRKVFDERRWDSGRRTGIKLEYEFEEDMVDEDIYA
jgi:hypothetical protein